MEYRRAVFRNPGFYCGFNSLTDCLYNVREFRSLVLNFELSLSRPFIVDDPAIPPALPEKVSNGISHFRSCVAFANFYTDIFRQMSDPTKVLDLTDCVSVLEGSSGTKILMDGPTDPLVEFQCMLEIFSISERMILCYQLAPPCNPFLRLFCFLTSSDFRAPAMNSCLRAPHRSTIFGANMAGAFYDFSRDDNPPDLTVLHSLPDVICVRWEDGGRYDGIEKVVQLTVDFEKYVFDKARKNVFRLNSFVMLHAEAHATTYVRLVEFADTEDEKWLICNDSSQELVDLDGLNRDLATCSPSRRPTVGFYERVASESSAARQSTGASVR
jgi:hypothetical protein